MLDRLDSGAVGVLWPEIWPSIAKVAKYSGWRERDVKNGLINGSLLGMYGEGMVFVLRLDKIAGTDDLALYAEFAEGNIPNKNRLVEMVEQMEQIGIENGAKIAVVEGRLRGWSRLLKSYKLTTTPNKTKALIKELT